MGIFVYPSCFPSLFMLPCLYLCFEDMKIAPYSGLPIPTGIMKILMMITSTLTYYGQEPVTAPLTAGRGWGDIRREAMMQPGQYWIVNGGGRDFGGC